MCERPLRTPGTQYLVEKAYRENETIYEYAQCLDCFMEMHEEISPESQACIDEYFEKRINFESRQLLLRDGINSTLNVDDWLAHCVVTRMPRSECIDYTAYALCDGPRLVLCDLPYIVSGQSMEEVVSLLSTSTRDRLTEFNDRYLGLPTEYMDIPRDNLVPGLL